MKTKFAVVSIALLLGNVGCAYNAMVGNRVTRSGVFYGEVGITGYNNDVIIERESRMMKLSLIGDGNKVFIQDDVRLPRIEFWGSNNEVSVPDYMYDGIRTNNVGKFNTIIKRPSTPGSINTTSTYYYTPTSPSTTLARPNTATTFETQPMGEETGVAPAGPARSAPPPGGTLTPVPSGESQMRTPASSGAAPSPDGSGVTYITTPSGTYVTRPTETGSKTEPMPRQP
ncbi:MAG: hypothetical protein U1D55_09930 [Phycisphaerae bacterium]